MSLLNKIKNSFLIPHACLYTTKKENHVYKRSAFKFGIIILLYMQAVEETLQNSIFNLANIERRDEEGDI